MGNESSNLSIINNHTLSTNCTTQDTIFHSVIDGPFKISDSRKIIRIGFNYGTIEVKGSRNQVQIDNNFGSVIVRGRQNLVTINYHFESADIVASGTNKVKIEERISSFAAALMGYHLPPKQVSLSDSSHHQQAYQ